MHEEGSIVEVNNGLIVRSYAQRSVHTYTQGRRRGIKSGPVVQ